MNKKIYKSKSNVSVRVVLSDAKSALVTFAPQIGGGSVFETTDTDLQNAMESHNKYGKLFVLYDTEDVATARTYPRVQYYSKDGELESKEDKSNKVTEITDASTDVEYPSAMAVYKGLGERIGKPSTEGTTGQVLQLNAEGKPEWVTPSAGTTPDSEMSDSSTNAVQNKVVKNFVISAINTAINTIKEWANSLFMKIGGYYPSSAVGLSDNITGEPIPVTTGYTLKATGYGSSQPELEFEDGQVKMTEVRGRACAWNQLVAIPVSDASKTENNVTITDNRDGSYTVQTTNEGASSVTIWELSTIVVTGGHKYLIYGCPTGGSDSSYYFADINGRLYGREYGSGVVLTALSSGNVKLSIIVVAATIITTPITFRPQLLDLTILNPTLAAKANLTVAEVEEYLASIRTPKPYYAQNAGQLLGAKMLGWQLRKTANLLNPTTKQAKLFEYSYTGHDNEYEVVGFDNINGASLQFTPYNTGVAEAVTLDSNNVFTIPSAGILEVVEATPGTAITGDVSRVCVVATWDGSMDGEIVVFDEDNVEIDSANIYWDNNGVKTQVFEGGVMRSTGDDAADVHDRVYFDKIAKKWRAEVKVGNRSNLSNLTWIAGSQAGIFYTTVLDWVVPASTNYIKSPCIFNLYPSSTRGDIASNKVILITEAKRIQINETSFSTVGDLKAAIANKPFWYALVTPITHDTIYYKVGNDYVPMEEVFPDGIQGLCCNWASENLVEQAEVDGQPQSITPITTEVFQSDYKELLKTIGDTYISKEQAKDSFDNLLSALNTNSATALGGTYATDGFNDDGSVKFTFTQAT